MKFSTIVDIFIELLTKRRVTAAYLAEKYELSPRTVYRYVEVLSKSVPLQIKRGRSGGITLADQFKLPAGFFTAEEYAALAEALKAQYGQTADEKFLTALEKLTAQERSEAQTHSLAANAEEVFIRGAYPNAEKLRVVESCIQASAMAEIEHEGISQRVEPHALVFENGEWGMYAFTHEKRDFALFAVGKLFSIVKLEEGFRKRPFEESELPEGTPKRMVNVRLEIYKNDLERAAKRLGIEHIRKRSGRYLADVSLPEDGLLEFLLALGDAVKVISPASLKTKLIKTMEEIIKLYT